jgi:hypothetical protein
MKTFPYTVSIGGVKITLKDCKIKKGEWRQTRNTNLQKIWDGWYGNSESFVKYWGEYQVYIYNYIGPKKNIIFKRS